ncbi:MAG: ATP-binding protein, partial [Tissierellia bacterium]|nr:ATP-binding protein [Tissierellia bacterium]
YNLYKKYINFNKLDSKEEYLNDYYNLCSLLIYKGYDSINDYISHKILVDENVFSLNCEKGIIISEKTKKAVYHDILIIKKVFELQIKGMADKAGDMNCFISYNKNDNLAEVFKISSVGDIYDQMCEEYESNGSGQYRNNYAFSINELGQIIPVDNFKPVVMEDIYGYNSQKSKIIKNTEKFVSGKFALNALLVGDSGTGKSTSVKALIPMFKNKKLRLIELGKENIRYISKVIEALKNRGMYYIIFIDDLSFESNEDSYKYLKSAVEGSIYEQPRNILFYVTSNRKHLIKESMLDRQNEIHMRDAINEQTSLSDRFGLTILYSEPNQNEYFEIVLGLAEKYDLKYEDKDQFLLEAKKFAMQNGGRTGRSAMQFIRTF